ncbi:TraB/GumN family protein [Sphingomonas sp. GB1N7]|uniref:TraB/GumN family protein n=1 Tax=Parasphingomonas caseinilytica TaxID=3096158 RepID=UPI002FC58CE2
MIGFRRCLFLALLALAGCGRPAVEARPALWRVSDGDTEIWLLGTIHALPPGVHWETPAVTRAIDGADTLVTEIAAASPETAGVEFAKFAAAKGLPPISERVAPEQHAVLADAAEAAGVSIETLNGLRTWAAAVTLAAGPMRATGASPEHGVEAALAARFAGRRRDALETQGEQLAIFNALPEAAQRVLLARALRDTDGYAPTLAAWEAGDVRALAASFEPAFRGAPELQRTLVTERNARWAGWIARRMGAPGHVLVAVGAGHLVGQDSVVAMLAARGLKVSRVQ